MKFVRYGQLGQEKPGLIDRAGHLRDLSGHIPDLSGDQLSRRNIEKLRQLRTDDLKLVEGKPRLGTTGRRCRSFHRCRSQLCRPRP